MRAQSGPSRNAPTLIDRGCFCTAHGRARAPRPLAVRWVRGTGSQRRLLPGCSHTCLGREICAAAVVADLGGQKACPPSLARLEEQRSARVGEAVITSRSPGLRTDIMLASGSWQGGQNTLGNRARKAEPGLGGQSALTVNDGTLSRLSESAEHCCALRPLVSTRCVRALGNQHIFLCKNQHIFLPR